MSPASDIAPLANAEALTAPLITAEALTAPLITAEALAAKLHGQDTPIVVLDCSFDLADPAAGRRAYEVAHIPDARYVHLDQTLSAPKSGRNGRHPLPDPATFAGAMAALGVSDATPVVACDNARGMFAARLWWLLQWVGHCAVSVLDGGMGAWRAAGLPVASGNPVGHPIAAKFTVRPSLVKTVDFATVRDNLDSGARLVIDARSPDRFRGENETIDPLAGHIPGAINRQFNDNLSDDGRFKPAHILRTEFEAIIAPRKPEEVVSQCGSGVTACHNLLAMASAGLNGAALYPGSWSEWIAQPGALVATGPA